MQKSRFYKALRNVVRNPGIATATKNLPELQWHFLPVQEVAMAVDTLIAAETFYLLSISQLIPSLFAKLRNRSYPIAYAPAIGIIAIVILRNYT
jgi:hypothetical protein